MRSKPARRLALIGIGSDEETGVGVHTASFARLLAQSSELQTVYYNLLAAGESISEQIAAEKFSHRDIVVSVNCNGVLELIQNCPAYKISYDFWESTRLPDIWLKNFQYADEYWTVTPWGKAVYQDNGLPPEKTFWVPAGVDTGLFHPGGEAHPFIHQLDGYKFLHIGKAETRKSTAELLQAFDAAFQESDNVFLVVAIHNQFINGFDTVRFIDSLSLQNRSKIIPVHPLEDREEFASLYRSCHSFIFPSKAEGFGLPALEALACGMPVAATFYSGHDFFLRNSTAIKIPHRMRPVTPFSIPHLVTEDSDYGHWGCVEPSEIATTMRYMKDNHLRLKKDAMKVARQIGKRFSWHAACRIAQNRLLEVSEVLERNNASSQRR